MPPVVTLLWIVVFALPGSDALLFAYQLPDTGQHTCYDDQGNEITCPSPGEPFYGQDAQYQGPEPAYQDNGDGTVTDLNTGLIWMQSTADTDGDGDIDATDALQWQPACDYCADLSYAGYSDWRLPDRRELMSIVDYGRSYPAINPVFDCRSGYWSGSTYYNPVSAWFVGFGIGNMSYYGKAYDRYVRCVRGSQTLAQTYQDNGDGTVTDTVTGLIWQQRDEHNDSGERTWREALDYCEDCTEAGYSDWRLPNIRELESLVDWDRYNPAIDPIFDCRYPYYCSGSNLALNPAYDLYVIFFNGKVSHYYKDHGYYVRCVRGGPADSRSFDTLTFPLSGTLSNRTVNLSFGADWPWGECPTGVSKRHTGVDLSAQAGESVYASHSGTVRAVIDARSDDWAWGVTIEDDSGEFTTVYWHVSPLVSLGDSVSKGEKIATVADLEDNTHLHFGIRKAPYSNISNRGALPRSECDDNDPDDIPDPAFPEYFVNPLSYFDASIQNAALTLKIYDSSSGHALEGATVTIGEKSETTGQTGEVSFEDLSPGTYKVKLSAPGFMTTYDTLEISHSGSSSVRTGLVPMIASTKPVISDVRSRYSNRDKPAFFLEGTNCDLAFSAHVDWNGHTPKEIRFITPQQTHTVSTDGSQNPSQAFDLGQDFGPGGRLKVVAVSQDGTRSEPLDANIEVMNLPPGLPVGPGLVLENRDFRYEGELAAGSLTSEVIPGSSTAVPEDIPIFGGKSMGMKVLAKVEIEIGSDGSARYSFIKPKKGNELKMAGVNFESKFELGGDVSFRYHEDDNTWKFDGGYLSAAVSAKKDVGPAYTIVAIGPVPVPVYLRGELEAELDGSIGFTGWAEGDGWELDGTVEPEAGGKAIAGVRVAKAMAVEGYLGLDASMQFGFPEDPVFRKTTVALSGGINLVMLFFTY